MIADLCFLSWKHLSPIINILRQVRWHQLDNQTKEMIQIRQRYNRLLFAISKYGLLNQKPPEKLIQEAEELGRQIGIGEEELKNIEFSRY
jgi:hypothetical protein